MAKGEHDQRDRRDDPNDPPEPMPKKKGMGMAAGFGAVAIVVAPLAALGAPLFLPFMAAAAPFLAASAPGFALRAMGVAAALPFLEFGAVVFWGAWGFGGSGGFRRAVVERKFIADAHSNLAHA